MAVWDVVMMQKDCKRGVLYTICVFNRWVINRIHLMKRMQIKKGQLKGAIGDLGHRNLQSMYCTERIWINKVIDDV